MVTEGSKQRTQRRGALKHSSAAASSDAHEESEKKSSLENPLSSVVNRRLASDHGSDHRQRTFGDFD